MRWEVVDDNLLFEVVRDTFRSTLTEQFRDQGISPQLLEQIRVTCQNILEHNAGHLHTGDIALRVGMDYAHDPGSVSIEPDNLFTGLLMRGINCYVAPGVEEIEREEGTYAFRNGQFLFRPQRPLEYVEINISLDQARALGHDAATQGAASVQDPRYTSSLLERPDSWWHPRGWLTFLRNEKAKFLDFYRLRHD